MFEKFIERFKPTTNRQLITALTAGESVRLGGPFPVEPPSSDVTHNDIDNPNNTTNPSNANNELQEAIIDTPNALEIKVTAHAISYFLSR